MSQMSPDEFRALLRRALAVPDTVNEICRLGGWSDPYASVPLERLRNAQPRESGCDMDQDTVLAWVEKGAAIERRFRVAAEIARCRQEIATIEAQIRAGHPDLLGLCRSLLDWNAELRLLEQEK
jgi:hypothetical protein